jgi:hypothetical protein
MSKVDIKSKVYVQDQDQKLIPASKGTVPVTSGYTNKLLLKASMRQGTPPSKRITSNSDTQVNRPLKSKYTYQLVEDSSLKSVGHMRVQMRILLERKVPVVIQSNIVNWYWYSSLCIQKYECRTFFLTSIQVQKSFYSQERIMISCIWARERQN